MNSLKTTCIGQIFALAKPHDSVGKRTRNRIPKEERKALVESFIKKHQNLNNGSFPSLSLTHKEVGGSFYTVRELVREIIQENRVLGPADLILEGNGSDHLQEQSLSSSILMDPVPPLSLSVDGFHSESDQSYNCSSEAGKTKSLENRENINGSQIGLEDSGSDILKCEEMNATQHFNGDAGLSVHQSFGSTDVYITQFAASCSEENVTKHDVGLQNRVQIVCDSFATKPQDKGLSVDNKDKGFDEIPFIESEGTKLDNNDEIMNDYGENLTEMANMAKNTLGTIDMPEETVSETFPLKSATSTMESADLQSSELDKVCYGGKETETKVETEINIINPVDLGEISSSTSAGQMPNLISAPMEKKVGEKVINPASLDVEYVDTKGAEVVNVMNGNLHETKEISNGTLTPEQKMPTSGPESGRCKNDKAKVKIMSSHGKNEVAGLEKATMEKEKLDACSQTGNIATLNRIKPESWKGQSNMTGQETNPVLAVLKSFLAAFVKFWSE